MLFLNPVKFKEQIRIKDTDIDAVEAAKIKEENAAKEAENNFKNSIYPVLYAFIWCFYGFREGKPWAAVSLWRGLGLMVQVLKITVEGKNYNDEKDKSHKDGDSDEKKELEEKKHQEKKERIQQIKIILKKHLNSALLLGKLPGGREEKMVQAMKSNSIDLAIKKRMDVIFPKWDAFDEQYTQSDTKEEYRLETAVNKMAEDLETWLKKVNSSKRILPMLSETGEDNWEKCFIRRLHGENLMGVFWQDLENIYYQKRALHKWDLHLILSDWFSVLADYWKDCKAWIPDNSESTNQKEWKKFREDEGIDRVLMECPILKGADLKLLDKYKKSLKQIKIETINEYSIFWDSELNKEKGSNEEVKENE
jgi:hypothetical protein